MFQDVGKPNAYWPVEKYDALADQFDPQNYDPDRWMEAAAKAGFKYSVLVARHCDGYALWPSEYGDFQHQAEDCTARIWCSRSWRPAASRD